MFDMRPYGLRGFDLRPFLPLGGISIVEAWKTGLKRKRKAFWVGSRKNDFRKYHKGRKSAANRNGVSHTGIFEDLNTKTMEIETIHGQIIAKANHYQAVPGKGGAKRIIKDGKIRAYERSFMQQCRIYRNRHISGRFRLFVRVFHGSVRFDLDNSLKTLLDCLQMVGAITDDKLCFQIEAEKKIDRYHPRVEFALLEVNEQKQLFV